jgi:hypothetical protein
MGAQQNSIEFKLSHKNISFSKVHKITDFFFLEKERSKFFSEPQVDIEHRHPAEQQNHK